MANISQSIIRYLRGFLYALVTLAIAAGFCGLLLSTALDFLNDKSTPPQIRTEAKSADLTDSSGTNGIASERIETSASDNSTGLSNVNTGMKLQSSKTLKDEASPDDRRGLRYTSIPTALPGIDQRTHILPLTIEIATAALNADYQSLITLGMTTSEAIKIIDQYVDEGKYGDMGKRPTTLEAAEAVFFSDYDRMIASGLTIDESINQLIGNAPTGRYGIYADILFQLLENVSDGG